VAASAIINFWIIIEPPISCVNRAFNCSSRRVLCGLFCPVLEYSTDTGSSCQLIRMKPTLLLYSSGYAMIQLH